MWHVMRHVRSGVSHTLLVRRIAHIKKLHASTAHNDSCISFPLDALIVDAV